LTTYKGIGDETTTMLCKYRAVFGKPGEGVHAYRVFDVAVVDVVMTVVAAVLLSRYVLGIPVASLSTILVVVALFAVGVVAHRLFCVRTRIDRLLFSA
jgi:hypothetical protein